MTDNATPAYLHENAKAHLRSFIERVERLESEKKALTEDIAEVLKEAKGYGFDTKTIRKIIAMRRKEEHQRLEEEAILVTYLQAMDMLPQLADLPLGKAAIAASGHEPSGSPHSPEASVASQGKADMERAHQRGQEAAEDRLRRTDNPYLFADPRHGAWDAGFAGRVWEREEAVAA